MVGNKDLLQILKKKIFKKNYPACKELIDKLSFIPCVPRCWVHKNADTSLTRCLTNDPEGVNKKHMAIKGFPKPVPAVSPMS